MLVKLVNLCYTLKQQLSNPSFPNLKMGNKLGWGDGPASPIRAAGLSSNHLSLMSLY